MEGNKQPGPTLGRLHGIIHQKIILFWEEIPGNSSGGSGISLHTFKYFPEFLLYWPP
jgi:hypothetical protein